MSGLTVYESIRFNKLSVRAADERVKVASAAQERQRAEGCFDTDLSPLDSGCDALRLVLT